MDATQTASTSLIDLADVPLEVLESDDSVDSVLSRALRRFDLEAAGVRDSSVAAFNSAV